MPDLGMLMDLAVKDRASQVLRQVAAESDKAGKAADRHGDALEHSSSRGRKALGLLAGTFVSSSNQALGSLQEVVDKFDVMERASEASTSKIGGRLLGVGAGALAASTFLQTLASRDQEANNRLRASIEASGKSYEDYAERIEKAVHSSEHLGYQASQTQDALNRLTITTHNPEEALRDLSVAQDVAAAKGISLAKAAEVVGLTFNGSTRAGKQFGLHLVDVKKATQELTASQRAAATSGDAVARAQQSYSDKLAVYQSTSKHTLAQQLALFRAHQAVTEAQDKDAAAKARLHRAQVGMNDAAKAGARNVAQLEAVVHGQGEASADSFAGHLRALGARIEDTASKFGHEYGGAIQTASLATVAIGTVVEAGLIPKLGSLVARLGLTGTAFRTLAAVEASSSAAGAAAIAANAAVAEGAMLSEAATAEVAAGRIATALGGARVALSALAGPAGLVAAVGGAGIYESLKYTRGHSGFGLSGLGDDPVSNFLFGKRQKPRGADLSATENEDDRAADYALKHPKQLANAAKIAAASHAIGKAAVPESLASFLRGAGLSTTTGGGGGGGAGRAASNAFAQILKAKLAADKEMERSDRAAVEHTKKRQAAVNSLLGTYRDYARGISDTAHQFTSVINSFPQTSNRDIGGLLNGLGSQLSIEKRFATEIGALQKRGLNKGLIQQLIEAGPSQIGLVDSLFRATLPQLRQVNADISAGNAGATALAKLGVASKFGPNAEAKALAEQKKANTLLSQQNHTLELLLAQDRALAGQIATAVTHKARKTTHR